jgi:hypothetical protein
MVDGPVAVTCDHSSGSTFAPGSTTVTCTAADTKGNIGQGSFAIKVQHTTPPKVEVPDNMMFEATSLAGVVANYEVKASDTVDRATVTCDHPSGSTFAPGPTTVTCTATDTYNNVGHGSFQINVRHTPKLTPTDMMLEATSPRGAVGVYTVVANDLVDTPTVNCVPPSGSTFALDTRTVVTCTATDSQGSKGQGSFQVYVRHTIPPVIPVANMTLEATSFNGAVGTYTVIANDPVDHATVVCVPPSGSVFALDTKTNVTCTATDDHHNTGQGSFQVYVHHIDPPVVNVPKDITKEITYDDYYYHQGTVISYSVSVKDTVDTATVTCAPPPGSIFHPGLTTVTCTATDVHKNVGRGSFRIDVRHTPTVYAYNITREASSSSGTQVYYPPPNVNDVVDKATVTCSPVSGSTFPIGTTTVNCVARDTAGYQGTGAFQVTVVLYTTPTPPPEY